MKQYLDLLEDILSNGIEKSDRTGVGTKSVFGRQLRFNLGDGFPLLTTKKLHLKSIIYELLWFLKGDTNIGYLNDHGVHIWDDWADSDGNLNKIYGYQFRSWEGKFDQISNVIEQIKIHPESRRLVVSAWNASEIDEMALAPCHCLFQFNVRGEYLDLQLYQRSADCFLGVPFNIASYSLLLMMVSQVTGYKPGEFVHTLGDAHLYLNHLEQAEEQIKRTPYELPSMKINKDITNIFDFKYEDFELVGYRSWPHIKAEVAV